MMLVVHMLRNKTSGEFKFAGRVAPNESYEKFANTWDLASDTPKVLHIFDATLEEHGFMVVADSRSLAEIQAEALPPVGALQGGPATPRQQASDAPDASEYQHELFRKNAQMHHPARAVRTDGNVSTPTSHLPEPDNKQTRAGKKVGEANRIRVESWMIVIRSPKLQQQMSEEQPELLEKILAWYAGVKAGGAKAAEVIAYRMCVLKDEALMKEMESTDPDALTKIRAWHAAVKEGSAAGGAKAAEVIAYRMSVLKDEALMEEMESTDPDGLTKILEWHAAVKEGSAAGGAAAAAGGAAHKAHVTKAKMLAVKEAAAITAARGSSGGGSSGGDADVVITFTKGDTTHPLSGQYTRKSADRWQKVDDPAVEITLMSTGHWDIQQLAETKGRQPFRSVAGPPKDTTLYGLGGMWDIAPEGGSRLAFGWLATVVPK